MATIIVTVLIGVTCVAFGYLISKKQMLDMLAGYDPKKVTDKEGLARWVGTNLVLMGILAFFSAALMAVLPQVLTVTFHNTFATPCGFAMVASSQMR